MNGLAKNINESTIVIAFLPVVTVGKNDWFRMCLLILAIFWKSFIQQIFTEPTQWQDL